MIKCLHHPCARTIRWSYAVKFVPYLLRPRMKGTKYRHYTTTATYSGNNNLTCRRHGNTRYTRSIYDTIHDILACMRCFIYMSIFILRPMCCFNQSLASEPDTNQVPNIVGNQSTTLRRCRGKNSPTPCFVSKSILSSVSTTKK